jgi:sortase A
MRVKPAIAAVVLVAVGSVPLARGAWLYAKAALAQVLLEEAWQETVGSGRATRPWPWADTFPVARLEVPRLDEAAIVLAGGTGRTMAFGPGHLDGSARPGGAGNCVLSGHRDTHFAFLEHLHRGDQILLEDGNGRVHRYSVVESAVVDEEQTWVADGTDGRVLTLVTCYPFRSTVAGGSLRYVVWAEGAGVGGSDGAGGSHAGDLPSAWNPLANRELSSNIPAHGLERRFPPTGARYWIAGGDCG